MIRKAKAVKKRVGSEAPRPKQRSFLRWAGSKRQLLSCIAKKAPKTFRRYVEPFMGSASLFFYLQPSSSLLGDLNPELVCTMNAVKSMPDKVLRALSRLPAADKPTYLRLRKQSVAKLSPATRAARFIYLNRYCFNGLWRTNLKGEFNVPFAPLKTGRLPDKNSLKETSKALKTAVVKCCDFGTLIKQARKGDFVYLDPPYRTSSTRVFREYGSTPFDFPDLTRLMRCLKRLDKKQIPFVLSYTNCPEARSHFKSWKRELVQTQRNVAGFRKHRRTASELLIWNKYCEVR